MVLSAAEPGDHDHRVTIGENAFHDVRFALVDHQPVLPADTARGILGRKHEGRALGLADCPVDGPVTDEKFARGLLMDHLTECGASGFQCKVNEADPPDIVVTWENGAQWGVEVIRTYQQVASFEGGEPVSSENIAAPLRNFGEQLGEKTQDIRKRGYTLDLEGPGRFSSWKSPVSKKRWREETEEAIRRHIVSNESGILKIPGVWLKPSEPGKRWTISVRSGAAEISSATATMLWRAMDDKTKDLPWKGRFSERWLLLLNCYPLIEDLAQVEDTLQQLILKHPELAGFNGIFWSGPPDWKLSRVPIVCTQA